jgi:hypothetical protein
MARFDKMDCFSVIGSLIDLGLLQHRGSLSKDGFLIIDGSL